MPDGQQARASSFGRACRLLRAAEFQRVFDSVPLKSADRYFTVLAAPSQAGRARIGLVVMRKRIRRAVARNRVKRLVRESFRHRQNLPALDLVVLARDAAALADSGQLFASLSRHWQRLSQRCADSSSA